MDQQAKEWLHWAGTKGIGKVQSWRSFTSQLSVPVSYKEAEKRAGHNIRTWRGNYSIICLCLSAYTLFTTPSLLIALVLSLGMWYYAFAVHKQPIVFQNRAIKPTEKALAVSLASLLVFFVLGVIFKVIWLLGFCGLLVVAHLVTRKPTLKDKAMSFVGSTLGGGSDDEGEDEDAEAEKIEAMEGGGVASAQTMGDDPTGASTMRGRHDKAK
jgi:hypothetical protein